MTDPLCILPWSVRDQNEPVIVLCGAGASVSAGLPDATRLCTELLSRLSKKLMSSEIPVADLARKTPLETCFQIVADHASPEIVQQIINELDTSGPVVPHRTVSYLASEGLLQGIYTFNFDTLQEQALSRLHLQKRDRFGRSVILTYLGESNTEFRLVKLHGSADQEGVMTLSEYVRGFPEQILEIFYRDFADHCWLVLGYGGWDFDFQQAIADSIARGFVPKELIWVDRTFPTEGGRTEVLRQLAGASVPCVPHERDLEVLCQTVLCEREIQMSRSARSFDAILAPLDAMSIEDAARILVDVALNAGELSVSQRVLQKGIGLVSREVQWNRENAILQERLGHLDEAAELYRQCVSEKEKLGTRLMAVTRAFTLSKGRIDLFDILERTVHEEPFSSFIATFRATRRTDLGGLDREAAASLVNSLPNIKDLLGKIDSLDLLRFLVSTLSELARVYHEASNWNAALLLDLLAQRVAGSLNDYNLISMTSGNIGACYMGLSKESTESTREAHLAEARKHLEAAVSAGSSNRFAHSLHSCNLGLILCDLQDFMRGLPILRHGLRELEIVYPNYAVCFFGELGRIYSEIAYLRGKGSNRLMITAAKACLNSGFKLAESLRDYDDISYLREGIFALKRVTDLIPDSLAKLITDTENRV